eukprot:6022773-Pyramimonas_sp.AAC.1
MGPRARRQALPRAIRGKTAPRRKARMAPTHIHALETRLPPPRATPSRTMKATPMKLHRCRLDRSLSWPTPEPRSNS